MKLSYQDKVLVIATMIMWTFLVIINYTLYNFAPILFYFIWTPYVTLLLAMAGMGWMSFVFGFVVVLIFPIEIVVVYNSFSLALAMVDAAVSAKKKRNV